MSGQEDTVLAIKALGRPLRLGMLYNASNDSLIPEISLWHTEDIKKKTVVSPYPNTRFKVSASESLREKLNLVELNFSLRASMLFGLIKFGVSGHYLKEKTTSRCQCRVTLHFQETTEVRELMITDLGYPDPTVLRSATEATHVVTQVLYGAHTFMEFEKTATDHTNKKEIQGWLFKKIKKVPDIKFKGGSMQMNDEDNEKVNNFRCKIYSDIKLETNDLATFEEAVKLYKELPKLLGERAVPVKVWLYPLSKLTNSASKMKRMISVTLVSAVEKVMHDFHQAEMRTNDLLEKGRQTKAEDMITKLEKFQSRLRDFKDDFLQRLTGLKAIRGGDKEESALRDLLKSQHASGFSGRDMEQWLDGKETEISVVTMYISKLNYDIKPPGPEFDSFLRSPDVTDAFVFNFTSLRYEEPYLDKISQAAKSFKSGSTISTSHDNPTEGVPWYRRPEVKESLVSAFSVFNKITHKNKAISFIPDLEHLGASVRWYHNAVLKDSHVTNNSIPPT